MNISPKKVAFHAESYGSVDHQNGSDLTADLTPDNVSLVSLLEPWQQLNSSVRTTSSFDPTSSSTSFDRSSSFSSFESSASLRLTLINTSNAWTSVQRTADKYELDMVPTQVTNNVKLVVDPDLDPGEKGSLYYSVESLFNSSIPPEYALTVSADIYQRVLREVNDAISTPCGVYFCCHGGDGAHTGVSHDDHVDISVAWALGLLIFAAMMVLEFCVPVVVYTVNADDDFFE